MNQWVTWYRGYKIIIICKGCPDWNPQSWECKIDEDYHGVAYLIGDMEYQL